MLRIAVQSKGRLFEDTMALLAEADIKLPTSKRTLLTQSSNFPVEVLFLRDDDIPQCVASGVADLGIVGENEFAERNEDAEVVYRLGFSKCRLSLAIHKEIDYPETAPQGKRYPGRDSRHHRFGGNCSGYRTGRCHLRYRKFRLYPHQQQPEGSGSHHEKRSLAYRQQEYDSRKEGSAAGTSVPSECRKSRRRQEIRADERTDGQNQGYHRSPARYQESDHHATGYRRMEQHPHRTRPEMFLGNHRETESHRCSRYPSITD